MGDSLSGSNFILKSSNLTKTILLSFMFGGATFQCGAASIVMFTGPMDAIRFGEILDASLIPFLSECFPDGH